MTRLPGFRYIGPDPDGFMTMGEVVGFFERYAASFRAPVMEGTMVEALCRLGSEHIVGTDQGSFKARAVVIATGDCDRPAVPPLAASLPGNIRQITSSTYRTAEQLP